jgi:hypothetical protein
MEEKLEKDKQTRWIVSSKLYSSIAEQRMESAEASQSS